MTTESAEALTTIATIKKPRRSPNDYLRLGIRAIYADIAAQRKETKEGKNGRNGEKGKKDKVQDEGAFALPDETAQYKSKLIKIVVRHIVLSAVGSTKARGRNTIMPADVLYAVSNKFLVSSNLVPKHVNDLREEHHQQYVVKITEAVKAAEKQPYKSARVICKEQGLRFRSVFSENALRHAGPSLKVSRDSIVALTVFIHYFARFLCFMAMRNQIRDHVTRLRPKHVQQAIRGDLCLAPHYSHVRILGGYHYSNAYGKISDGDKLCANKRRK